MLREIRAAMQDTGNIHMVVPHLLFPMAGACRRAIIGSLHHARHPPSGIHPLLSTIKSGVDLYASIVHIHTYENDLKY